MVVDQNDPALNIKIFHYGCGILSGCYLTGKDWNAKDVNNLYYKLLNAKAIDADCTITWAPFAKAMGMTFIKFADADYVCASDEIEIQQWYNPNTKLKHFVVGNGKKDVLYDPVYYHHEGGIKKQGSNTVAHGYIIGKRIFKMGAQT